jgi:hypothetical protein
VDIYINKLNYKFSQKPLLVGGMAMEYYNLRKSGVDIDLLVPEIDVINLIKIYPNRVKDLWGDLGVCPLEFEIWKTICYFDYTFYVQGAIDIGEILVISMEKLLFMKALAMKKKKYFLDAKLIAQKILDNQGKYFGNIQTENNIILNGITDITIIEKTGPVK